MGLGRSSRHPKTMQLVYFTYVGDAATYLYRVIINLLNTMDILVDIQSVSKYFS